MINFTINAKKALQYAEKELGEFSSKAPQVVRTAINQTAKDAQKLLLSKAKETYAVKGTAFTGKSGSAMRITRATTARLQAKLHSEGSPIDLYKFKTSPSKYATGSARPSATRAKALRANSLKNLKVDTRWAFVVQFKNGHVTLAQRVGKKRLPIKTLYSVSSPQMIGDETRVYNIVEPEVEELLYKNLRAGIAKIKGG
jgi:hypothetical protein